MTFENDSWQLRFAATSMTQLTLQFSLLTSLCRFVLSFCEVYYEAPANNMAMLVYGPMLRSPDLKKEIFFYLHKLGVDP